MKGKSFEIALSGVATAIAALFLSLGVLSPYLLMTGYLLGSFAMMLPLSKQFVQGGILAYAASSLLAFFLGGSAFFWRLLPFLVFFGLHPLINHLQLKYNVNRWLAYAVKAIWFDGTLVLIWFFVCGGAVPMEFVNRSIGWLIAIGGTIFFYWYDYLFFSCQISVNRIVDKIKRN